MKKKKVLAMLMTLTLTASMCPLTAFAANMPAANAVVQAVGDSVGDDGQEGGGSGSGQESGGSGDTGNQGGSGSGDTGNQGGSGSGDSENQEGDDQDNEQQGAWVLMNIPYDVFYTSEMKTNNSVEVDACSSASLTVVYNGEHGRGSYRVENADTTDIHGITFPVWVNDISQLETLGGDEIKSGDEGTIKVATHLGGVQDVQSKGKDLLFGASDYSYYVLTEEEWKTGNYALYKEATISDGTITLGETLNKNGDPIGDEDITTIQDSGYTFKTTSTWGDYELDLSIDVEGADNDITDYIHLKDTDETPGTVIYGVVMTAVDGDGKEYDYPLRHIENVWSVNELGWNVGFSKTVHDTTVQSDLYASLPGQSISYVTYYTNQGVYKVELYKDGSPTTEKVLKKYNIGLPSAMISAGESALTLTDVDGNPVTFDPFVTVDAGLAGGAYQNGKITWTTGSALPGSYTVSIADKANEYAELSTSLVLSTDTAVATYDADSGKLVAAEGASAADLANFIKNIETVSVDDTAYAASGRGAAVIIKSDGSIDWEVTAGRPPVAIFAEGTEYAFKVSSAGYPEMSFNATKKIALQDDWISSISSQVYTGKAITPEVTVTVDGKALTKGVDYELDYENNTDAGVNTAIVKVTGIGKYTGTATAKFTINKAASNVTLSGKTVTYNGQAVSMSGAKVTGSTGKVTYKYYSDSACTKEVAAANVKNAGTYYVKATVAADSNHNTAISAAAKLVISPAASSVTLPNKAVTYTGRKIAMTGAKVAGSTGKVTYQYYSNKACTKAVSVAKVKNAGTYYVKATVAADGNYKTATSSAAKLTVKAAAQKITCKKATASYKASALKLKKRTFKIGASANGKGKITYTKTSNKNKSLSVSKTGVVTVKKGLKKGTYTVKVKMTAAKKGNYAKTTVTKTIKVKVTK